MHRKILVLNERDVKHPLAGGAEIHLFEIFSRLAKRGFEVTLLCATFDGAKTEEYVEGIKVKRLCNRYLYYARVPLAARKEANQGYDIVVDALCKLPFLSPWFIPIPCLAIAYHLFGTSAFSQVSLPIATLTWLSEKLIPFCYKNTNILSISESTRKDFIARGLDKKRLVVVPPGVDHEIYCTGKTDSSREDLILWIGRIEPYKSLQVLIKAMPTILSYNSNIQLVVIGEGAARQSMEKLVQQMGLRHAIKFTGFISDQEKVAYLRKTKLLINTSEKEGWGMTVIEANACGAPTISSDVPGFRDSVKDRQTGFLVPYGDKEMLAAAVIRVMGDDKLWKDMSDQGILWSKKFTWEQVTDVIENLIETCIDPGIKEVPVEPPTSGPN